MRNILDKLLKLRNHIRKIDDNSYNWPKRDASITRLQQMCDHAIIAKHQNKMVCAVCGSDIKRKPKGATLRKVTLAFFINVRHLQGRIPEI